MSLVIRQSETTSLSGQKVVNRKSRRGCITCKSRKVKCDETKPQCRRCVSAGRDCGGYEDPFVTAKVAGTTSMAISLRPSPVDPSPPKQLSAFSVVGSDLRAIDFYTHVMAPKLGGGVDSSFWTGPVLQLSQSEPAIRQAMIMVSNLYEQKRQSDRVEDVALSKKYMMMHSKALQATALRLADGEADVVALVTCILFMCLEFIQGQRERAKPLFYHGMMILQGFLNQSEGKSTSDDIIQSNIVPMFRRLVVLVALFNQPAPPLWYQWRSFQISINSDKLTFNSLAEARNVLDWLMPKSHALVKMGQWIRFGPEHTQHIVQTDIDERKVVAEQQEHMKVYQAWLAALDKYVSATELSPEEQRKETLLRIYHTVSVTWLSCVLSKKEIDYLKHHDNFEVVVHQAQKIIAATEAQKPTEEPFTFEQGVLPPLYFTTLRCRNQQLRREALKLMQKAPQVEGLWFRDRTIRIAERAIEIEGDYLNQVIRQQTMLPPKSHGLIWDIIINDYEEDNLSVTFKAESSDDPDKLIVWDERLI